ncbi:MAG: hypothetical protein ABF893_05810 [Gluconacetobacter liquefaciens]|nr:hypothetical protein [Gluconacetobacter liquefaciens]
MRQHRSIGDVTRGFMIVFDQQDLRARLAMFFDHGMHRAPLPHWWFLPA